MRNNSYGREDAPRSGSRSASSREEQRRGASRSYYEYDSRYDSRYENRYDNRGDRYEERRRSAPPPSGSYGRDSRERTSGRYDSGREYGRSGSSSTQRSRSGARPSPSSAQRGGASRRQGNQPRRRTAPRRRVSPLVFILLLVIVILVALLVHSCVSNQTPQGSYKLSFDSQNLVVGETAQVTIEGLPQDSASRVIWSSSDPAVITVNDRGELRARRQGEASIAATIDGESFSATFVVSEANESVSSVVLNQKSLTLVSGDTFQLSANVTMSDGSEPGKILWTSSNSSVARVSGDGNVTARDPGVVSITATSGSQSAVCMVTVQADPSKTPQEPAASDNPSGGQQQMGSTVGDEPLEGSAEAAAPETGTEGGNDASKVTGVTLNASNAAMTVRGTLTLTASITPSSLSSVPIEWASSDKSIATVSDGVITAKKEGTVEITATAGSYSAACVVEISKG